MKISYTTRLPSFSPIICILTCKQTIKTFSFFLILYNGGYGYMTNYKTPRDEVVYMEDGKKQSFSLFNCPKNEFKEWFDPL